MFSPETLEDVHLEQSSYPGVVFSWRIVAYDAEEGIWWAMAELPSDQPMVTVIPYPKAAHSGYTAW